MYYLQELSLAAETARKQGTVDVYADKRYLDLRAEVVENMRSLSPAQLVACAMSFARLKYGAPAPWKLLLKVNTS